MPDFDIATLIQYLPWIVSGVFGLILLSSFLFGLKRGAFKGTFRLITVLFSFFVAFFFSGYVSQLIINFNFGNIPFIHNLAPDFTSVSALIVSMLNGVPEIANMMAASEAFNSLVMQFPLLITNVFVFFILFYTLKFLTWFVYAIASAIVVKRKKKKAKEEQKAREVANGIIINYYEASSPKKTAGDRSWGGLMGLVQGFVLALVFFLPFNGLVNTYFDVREALEPSTPQAYEYAQTYSNSLDFDLDEIIPADLHNALSAYRLSAPSVVFGLAKLDRSVLDYVSSIKVENRRVSLFNEIRTLANVFADIKYFMDLDFENIDWETFDFEKLEQVVTNIFNSDVFSIIAPELLKHYGQEYAGQEGDNNFAMNEAKAFMLIALAEIESDTLKSDVLAVIRTAKAVQTAGIFGAIKLPEAEIIAAVIDCLTVENTTSIFEAMLGSYTLRHGMIYSINRSFDMLDDEFDIEITQLVFEEVVWTNVASSFAELINSIVSNNLIYDFINGDIDFDNPNPVSFLNGDYLLGDIGKILDIAKSNPLLSDSLSKLILSFESEEFAEYVDLATLASNDFSYEAEFGHIDDVIAHLNAIKDSNDKTLFELIEAGALPEDLIAVLNDNIESVKLAADAILSIELFQSSADKLFNVVGEFLAEQLDVEISDVDISNIDWTAEKALFVNILEQTVALLNDVDLEAFAGDVDFEALSEHLTTIGAILDMMSESVLLSEIYDGLVEYLSSNEEIAAFVDFSVVHAPGFSWETELGALAAVVDVLGNSDLLEGFGSGSIQEVLQQLTEEDITTIVEAIVGSALLSDVLVTGMNELIESLNQTEGLDIDLIPSDIDLASQSEDIIEVLVSILPIIDSITGDVDIENLSTEDFGAVLNALANSHANEGVFSGVYEAIVDFLLDDFNYGAAIEAELTGGETDWVNILNSVLGII